MSLWLFDTLIKGKNQISLEGFNMTEYELLIIWWVAACVFGAIL